MYISNLAIKRPIFTVMAAAALMVLGLVGITFLGVDLLPDVSIPFIVVSTPYPGAAPEEVETLITKPIEDAVSSVNGIKRIKSTSSEGLSLVLLEFTLETPIKLASVEVREKIAGVRRNLPKDIEEPVIQRFDPSASPILFFSVASTRPSQEIRRLIEDKIKPRLEQLEGVAALDIIGGLEREIQVNLDPRRLEAYRIPVAQVIEAVASENLNVPGGKTQAQDLETVIRTKGEFRGVAEAGEIIVTHQMGTPIKLRDLGEVTDGFKDLKSRSRLNGREAVSFGVRKQSGANTVAVVRAVRKELKILQQILPPDIKIDSAYDASVRIIDDLKDVRENLILGGIMAVLVVFVFMRDWRSTVITALALPTSVVSTFFMMYIFGFTINIMTLLALSLAIGMLIDDAVVVRENIFRHMERGEDPFTAARQGTAEIGLAVMATTFTIVAVFIPVAFMSGIVGRFFKEFGLTVTFAVMISLFIAFTLDPMLSSRFVRPLDRQAPRHTRWGIYLEKIGQGYTWLDRRYRDVLDWSLKNPRTVLLTAGALMLSCFLLIPFIGKEFMPRADMGELQIFLEMPPGSPLELTDAAMKQAESALLKMPEMQSLFTYVGVQEEVHKAKMRIKLVPKSKRKKNLQQVKLAIRRELKKIPGLKFNVADIEIVEGEVYEAPISIAVRGDDMKVLQEVSAQIARLVRQTPGSADVDTTLERGKPEVEIRVNRWRAADLGLGVGAVARTLRALLEGEVASKFRDGEKEYDIRVRLLRGYRRNVASVADYSLLSPRGKNVTLREVVDLIPSIGPAKIDREARQRQVQITAELSGRPLGDVLDDIKQNITREQEPGWGDKIKKFLGGGAGKEAAGKVVIPRGYILDYPGEAERMAETYTALLGALLLAVIFIYMILASQFESLVNPVTIMLALPLAIIGALWALFLAGNTLSLMSMIGIVMLMGLVTKNSILLIEFTLHLQREGMSREEALLTAGPIRLRPILMTSCAMIFGMLPSALGFGAAAEMRQPMAIAVIGGLITSTILTLVVVPVVHVYVDQFKDRIRERLKII